MSKFPLSKNYRFKIDATLEYTFSLTIKYVGDEHRYNLLIVKKYDGVEKVLRKVKSNSFRARILELDDPLDPEYNGHVIAILKYLTYECDYYLGNFNMVIRKQLNFDIEEKDNLTTLTYSIPNSKFAGGNIPAEYRVFYDNDQYVKTMIITCGPDGRINEMREPGYEKMEASKFISQNTKSNLTSVAVGLVEYYHPIILKNIQELRILPNPICNIIASYCISFS